MYRQTKNYENLQKRIFDGVGEYGIPQIEPTQHKECEWIGFNYARSEKNRTGKGVHFFLDDYQFNSVWRYPDKYLDMVAVPARYVRKQIPYGILGPLAVQVAGYVRDTDIECA